MPKTKFQDIVFTIMMVIVMVYALVVYNIAIEKGGMSNQVFLMALFELPVMGVIAFILEFVFVGKIVKKIAFSLVNPREDKIIFVILTISALTVCFMCPMMSFIATLLFKHAGVQFIAVWFQTTALNFPMALCWQLFAAGPLVRKIFGLVFAKQLSAIPEN